MASVKWQAWSRMTFAETRGILAFFTEKAGAPVAFKANRKRPEGQKTGAGIVTFKDQATALKLIEAAGQGGSIDLTQVLQKPAQAVAEDAQPLRQAQSKAKLVFVEPLNKSMQYIVTEDYLRGEKLSANQASSLLDRYYDRELSSFTGFFPDAEGKGALEKAVAQQKAVFKEVHTTRREFGQQRVVKMKQSARRRTAEETFLAEEQAKQETTPAEEARDVQAAPAATQPVTEAMSRTEAIEEPAKQS